MTCVCVCVCVCACSSTYFFRPDVFNVQRFFTLCLVVVMGLPSWTREVAELSLPLDESCSAEDPDSTELASSSGFHSQSERPREASEKDALSLSTTFATFKVILGFITMGIFLACPLFFSSSWPTTTHSVKSTVFGGTVGWHLAK